MFRIEARLVSLGLKTWMGSWGAAQNAEEKRLSPLRGVSELMDGSGRLREARSRHGRTLQAGEGGSLASCSP